MGQESAIGLWEQFSGLDEIWAVGRRKDRLEKLEEISNSFPGVETSYAVQAGREVRILVKPEAVSDDQIVILARDIVARIENELDYPGQIKVNVIRESRATEFAK